MRPNNVAIHFEKRSKAQHNDATEVNSENLRSPNITWTVRSVQLLISFLQSKTEKENWGFPNCLYLITEFSMFLLARHYFCSRSNSGKMRVYPHLCTANPEFSHHVGNINCSTASSSHNAWGHRRTRSSLSKLTTRRSLDRPVALALRYRRPVVTFADFFCCPPGWQGANLSIQT